MNTLWLQIDTGLVDVPREALAGMPFLKFLAIVSRVSVVRLPESLAGLVPLLEELSLTTEEVPPCLTSLTSLVRLSTAVLSGLPRHATLYTFIKCHGTVRDTVSAEL